MINSIVERNRFTSPITKTEKKILQSAIRLFLENGYSGTTIRTISDDCGLRQGTIAYHFHTKEDMLYYLIQSGMPLTVSEAFNEIISKIF